MSEEQLNQVAGGTISQTSDDSIFLYEHGLCSDWHGEFMTTIDWDSVSYFVDNGWHAAGITCVTSVLYSNRYYAGDKQISQEEAYAIVESKYPGIREK